MTGDRKPYRVVIEIDVESPDRPVWLRDGLMRAVKWNLGFRGKSARSTKAIRGRIEAR